MEECNLFGNIDIKPDKSIDLKLLQEHYAKFPNRWNTAFNFLRNVDIYTLPLGKIELDSDVFATISEYLPKERKDALYEAHKQYIDLQYVFIGSEYIGLTNNISELEVVHHYNEMDDIEFYKYNDGVLLEANSETFFIFFPTDIHQPCIKHKNDNDNVVRKLVIKIKY